MAGINRRMILLMLLLKKRKQREDMLKKRKWWVRPIFQERSLNGAWFTLIPRLRETDLGMYTNFMRMDPQKFDELLISVSPHIQKYSRRDSISPGERLAVTLRYLASGNDMKSISYLFRIAQCTVSKIVLETCCAIWRVLVHTVFPRLTAEKWVQISEEFETMWNFPHCIGAIDGKHVVVQAFHGAGSEYHNYKGSHSIVLLAVADAQYKFVSVDIGAPGRCSDGGILKASALGKKLDNGTIGIPPPQPLPNVGDVPYFIVGDAAFPLKNYLMKPYSGEFLPDEQIIFNYRLSRARRVVENSFGIMASRWRVYRRPILASVATVNAIVKATVCLHNWLLEKEAGVQPVERNYTPLHLTDSEDEVGNTIPGQWRAEEGDNSAFRNLPAHARWGSRNFAAAPALNREKLTNFFLSADGQVDWQWSLLPRVL